jgi:hypothetical protein
MYSRVSFLKLTLASTASVPGDEDSGSLGNGGCLAARGNAIEFIHHKTLKAH